MHFFSLRGCFYPEKAKGKVTSVSKEPYNDIKRSINNGISASTAQENERDDLFSICGLVMWKLSSSPIIPSIL